MENQDKKNAFNATLDRLSYLNRKPSNISFVVLVILYMAATAIVSITASSGESITILGHSIPLYTYAGMFSAMANICVIFLAVYYGKKGFVTALVVLIIQLPMILMSVIANNKVTSLPGIFGNLLAITAVVMIHVNNRKIQEFEKTLHDQVITDSLTGLPNGYGGAELVSEMIRRKEAFANVLIDLNGFKTINDSFGFDNGNETLVEIARRWKQIANDGLSETSDFVMRLDGDEFVLLIRKFGSEEDIIKTIRLYDEALRQKLAICGYDFYVSASYGYSLFPDDADNLETLHTYSSLALQEVKRTGGDERIGRFTSDLLRKEHIFEIENKIIKALENDTVFFLLQPQFDMDHKLRGFEALARIKDEDGQLMSPAVFIPVAEKVGLIDRLDTVIYRKSTAFVGELIKKTGSNVILSINVSVRHLLKKDFVDEIRELLSSSGIPATQLEIEITESIMIESMDMAMSCIEEIRNMGVQIAIDDFGTGYSSLSYLHSFPANLLKVDKSFIDQMNESDSSKQYVAAIISLGHIMGFEVISEGVEEEAELETLRKIGCDYIQGYLWGHPLPPEEAGKLVG